MTITRFGMTSEAIEELINQRVAEMLATYPANRVAKLVVESQSQNRDDGDNGNGREMKIEMAGEMETEMVGETETEIDEAMGMWFEKIETVFHISNCLERYQVKELIKLMTEVYCPRNEIQKIESKLWNLTVKNNDLAAYTQRFQELTTMCIKMVPEEEDRVEKFIGGLHDNI
ncbi:reverse transcriptase domain-containing protein [Tanacetum coccineum]